MDATVTTKPKRSFGDRMLDGIEKMGNKVPHPVLMFVYLIGFIAVLSAVLAALDVSVTEEVAIPRAANVNHVLDQLGGSVVPFDLESGQIVEVPDIVIEEQTFEVRSLLSTEGIRFMLSSFVDNFAGFAVVAVTFIAMMGVGVAEKAGMMGALIRKLVKSAPSSLITFFIVLVGVISSVASDAGYLILIPLAAAAFMSLGRHPLAGLAAGFAGVAAVFGVNILITPIDSMLTEITNEAIALTDAEPIDIMSNFYFGVVSSILLAVVAVMVTNKIVIPRLGKFDPVDAEQQFLEEGTGDLDEDEAAAEKRGLRFALYGLLASLLVIALLTVPSGAPLRAPETGAIIGATPFMASLIFLITSTFLACGVCYGIGAKTIHNSTDVINAITSTFSSLSGLILMLLMISQFIAYFNWTNMPRVAAVELAHILEDMGLSALPLLIGLIFVILVLDLILPGVVPKWAIFAPVFIPIFVRLGVAPQTVLAAYRVGDSPANTITPLMVYLPFIVTVAQRYDKKAGIGTIIALMIPYVFLILFAWILLFVAWWLLGIPLGPDSPIKI